MVAQIGRVTGRDVKKNRDSASNSLLLQAEISDEDDVQTVEVFRGPGIDANPPDNARAVVLPVGKAWQIAVAIDDGVAPDDTVDQGEIEIYSSASGSRVATIRLDDSGNIKIDADTEIILNSGTDYAVAYEDLKTAFDQLKSDFDTFVSTIFNLHNHPTAATGPVSVPSVTGSASTADMSGAKIDTVRVP